MKLLQQKDLANDSLFSKLQGNILKGHGRDFTQNIFVKFDKNKKKKFLNWMEDFSKHKITSCKKQLKENEVYKRNKVSGGVFYGFFFSASGYRFLNEEYKLFHDNKTFDTTFKELDASFLNGMKDIKTNIKLNDPSKNVWEKGLGEDIHAMILIADDNRETLGKVAQEIIKELDTFSRIATVEHGNAIRNANNDGLEHFGYVDGISQPLFFEDEIESYIKQNGVNKGDNAASKQNEFKFDPSAEVSLVLFNDPFIKDKNAFGSYFVFRKLEQNVRQFKKNEKQVAKKSGMKDEDEERAGASLVGRFEDGTPVVVSDEDGMIGSGVFNNFNYENETNAKCPYHAHIRKTNPRTEEHKTHIMARRGIPYGQRNMPMNIEQEFSQMPEKGVGLLFMSYQASIINQFEYIQDLANKTDKNSKDNKNPKDDKKPLNLDPVIGQLSPYHSKNISIGMLPEKYGDIKSLDECSFNSEVTMKGGEYFFAPSIPFLQNLKK